MFKREDGFIPVGFGVIAIIAMAAAGVGLLAGAALKPHADSKQRQYRDAGLDFGDGYVGVGMIPQATVKPADPPPAPKVEQPAPAAPRTRTVVKKVYVTPKPQPAQHRPPVVIVNQPPPTYSYPQPDGGHTSGGHTSGGY